MANEAERMDEAFMKSEWAFRSDETPFAYKAGWQARAALDAKNMEGASTRKDEEAPTSAVRTPSALYTHDDVMRLIRAGRNTLRAFTHNNCYDWNELEQALAPFQPEALTANGSALIKGEDTQ